MRWFALALLFTVPATAQEAAVSLLTKQSFGNARQMNGQQLQTRLTSEQFDDAWKQLSGLIAEGRCADATSAANEIGDKGLVRRVAKKCAAAPGAAVAPGGAAASPAPTK